MSHKSSLVMAMVLASMLLGANAQAMGSGTTKIQFKAKGSDMATAQLFIKRDISATSGGLPQVGSSSANDNLAGQNVNLTIGSATISGTADEKGKVSTPFAAKITGNGKGFQLKSSGGINIVELFPLNTADGKHTVTVRMKISASRMDPATQLESEVVLSDEDVTFDYTTKKGQIKGKNR